MAIPVLLNKSSILLPKLLTSRLQTILGHDYEKVLAVFSEPRKGSFRLNLLKGDGSDVWKEFEKKGISIAPFASNINAYFFDPKDDYTIKGTRAFYDGKIYLQSLSSMLPVLALDPKSGEEILDVCAAPGSKTTQIAMLMQNEGKITALEQNPIRYEKLIHNCKLQDVSIVEGKRIDAKVYLDPLGITKFDRILLDAPCSAEGRIKLDFEGSYKYWSLENIKKRSEVQYDLLSRAIKRLKKGGTLVYSTCTLAPEENEGVITRVLGENKDITLESIDLGLSEKEWWKSGISSFGSAKYHEDTVNTVRILPSDETEGFFMAKIKRN